MCDTETLKDDLRLSHCNTEQSVINQDLIDKFFITLTPRQREVSMLFYVDEMTQKQIGAELGVTRSRINQILKDVKTKGEKWIKST